MTVFTHKYGPMLCWVGVFVDFLGDHFAETGLVGKPFTGESSNRVPAQLHRPMEPRDMRLRRGYDIGLMAKPERMLELEFPFDELVLSLRKPIVSAIARVRHSLDRSMSEPDAYSNAFILLRTEWCSSSPDPD